jgi:RNA polymerase sigma-70 factor, ECF subfamily
VARLERSGPGGPLASHEPQVRRLQPDERATPIKRASRQTPLGVHVVADPSTAILRRPLGRLVPDVGARGVSRNWDRQEADDFIEALFAKHQAEIYAYLVRMLREPELAADLTQDAFVKAYKNYDTLEKPENARAWLYQIAHRVALDEIRRRKIIRFFPWSGESRGAAPSAEHLVMDAHLSGDMQRALARIPERQRAALIMAELHDLTGLELAAALGVSHVAARALLTRARESLRQALATERAAEADAEASAPRSVEPRR